MAATMPDLDESAQPSPSMQGVPIYGRDQLPLLEDGAESITSGRWAGANNETFRLLRCLEAVRDLTKQMGLLAFLPRASIDRRASKLLVTPLHMLAEQILVLLNTVKNDRSLRKKLNAEMQRETATWLDRLDQAGIRHNSELTLVRNKLAAHVDKEAVMQPSGLWAKVDFVRLLDLTDLLVVAVAHATVLDIYGWTEVGTPAEVWSLMSVDGTVLHLQMAQGQPDAILGLTLMTSPKITMLSELASAQEICRKLLPTDWKPSVKWPGAVVAFDHPIAVRGRE